MHIRQFLNSLRARQALANIKCLKTQVFERLALLMYVHVNQWGTGSRHDIVLKNEGSSTGRVRWTQVGEIRGRYV
ncbi:hypothetical protein M404DRAFT_624771 [Pisolithus tinctorius Marx 270]|uniref:Uncharacterized protein n=1 Tax=Pisolithus tinctorius Marx 270 TaxID=870435 RepID=A0A0C3J370_PISTI|nr:hypothetical protein M404DRAFT_624771 [Pisolithus tinctorius Marx 270]